MSSLAPSRLALTRPELRRYSRQMLLPEFAAQERLKAAQVLVVGAGGLGCPVIQYLAGAGVGRLRISDGDVVSVSNLHRQTLYTTHDVGRPKAQVAAARAQQVNPYTALEAAPALTRENAAALLDGVNLVIDATDNFASRYLVHDLCVAAGLPWVWGAASGLEGMVSRFDAQFGLRDLFPDGDGENDETADCNTIGVLGPVLGVVGSVMAAEALGYLAGLEGLYLKLWSYDTLSARTRLISLKKAAQGGRSL